MADLPQVSGVSSGVVKLVRVDEPSQIFLLLFSPVSRWAVCFWHIVGIGLAFCEKDELISVERFFQTVGLVLVWESIGGGWWCVL